MGLDRGPFAAATPARTDPSLRYSLEEFSELILPAFEVAGVRTACEIGVEGGTFTRHLLDWLEPRGGRLVGIDPSPAPEVEALAGDCPSFELVQSPSHDALRDLDVLDAYLIDGDHNYFTVAGELRLIEAAAGRAGRHPLVILQDVAWPTGRRDMYYAPERVPTGARQPYDYGAVLPWEPERTGPRGFRGEGHFAFARSEGGPGNGVWTAVEGFLAEHADWECLTIPCFFGLAVLWPRGAGWADRMLGLLGPLDGHPLLSRLEANRVVLYLRLLEVSDLLQVERRRNADRVADLQRQLDGVWAELQSARVAPSPGDTTA